MVVGNSFFGAWKSWTIYTPTNATDKNGIFKTVNKSFFVTILSKHFKKSSVFITRSLQNTLNHTYFALYVNNECIVKKKVKLLALSKITASIKKKITQKSLFQNSSLNSSTATTRIEYSKITLI